MLKNAAGYASLPPGMNIVGLASTTTVATASTHLHDAV
jgi:hypothetical protein